MQIKRIAIGNDQGGYDMKCRFVEHLRGKGFEVIDVGCDSTDLVRYPYFAAKVAGKVANNEAERGILICSTGIGMSIMANKFKGIRASLCTTTYMARMTRAHNNSNVLCLGGKTSGEFEALDMLDTWLETDYMGGRHDISLGIIAEAENTLSTGDTWTPSGPMK